MPSYNQTVLHKVCELFFLMILKTKSGGTKPILSFGTKITLINVFVVCKWLGSKEIYMLCKFVILNSENGYVLLNFRLF